MYLRYIIFPFADTSYYYIHSPIHLFVHIGCVCQQRFTETSLNPFLCRLQTCKSIENYLAVWHQEPQRKTNLAFKINIYQRTQKYYTIYIFLEIGWYGMNFIYCFHVIISVDNFVWIYEISLIHKINCKIIIAQDKYVGIVQLINYYQLSAILFLILLSNLRLEI